MTGSKTSLLFQVGLSTVRSRIDLLHVEEATTAGQSTWSESVDLCLKLEAERYLDVMIERLAFNQIALFDLL
jgi:hypothetical protein